MTRDDTVCFVGVIHSLRYGDSTKLQGIIDEVRISSVPRSAGWIAAQFKSMRDKFITLGPAEPTTPSACPQP